MNDKNLPIATSGSSVAIRNVSKSLRITSKLLANIDQLTEEDWAWWNGLDDEWKRLFTAHIYHADEIDFDDKRTYEYEELQELGQIELVNSDDLKKIIGLKDFNFCECEDDTIVNIKPLARLVNLTHLYLDYLQIMDITGLSNLKKLTKLTLSDSFFDDITPLANLKKLTSLNLFFNKISNIRPLSSLSNLIELNLGDNHISDIKPLHKLKKLQKLNLSNITVRDDGYNAISDLLPLSNLINLTELNLKSNEISDIAPLKNLINLTELNLDGSNDFLDNTKRSGNTISDISALSNLVNLTKLNLSHNNITNIRPLANLVNLTELDLSFNKISQTDINWLQQELPNCYIYADEQSNDNLLVNELTEDDWKWWNGLSDDEKRLLTAHIYHEDSIDFDNGDTYTYNRLQEMGQIDLDHSYDLKKILDLNFFYCTSNKELDISFIGKLINLTKLNLSFNGISDITVLAKLTNLTMLDLTANKISDITPLANLIKLTSLRLLINQIDYGINYEYVNWLQQQLPNCDIRF